MYTSILIFYTYMISSILLYSNIWMVLLSVCDLNYVQKALITLYKSLFHVAFYKNVIKVNNLMGGRRRIRESSIYEEQFHVYKDFYVREE